MMQVNRDAIKDKLEELRLLIHDTHAYIITIQEARLTPDQQDGSGEQEEMGRDDHIN